MAERSSVEHAGSVAPLEFVNLPPLMDRSGGSPDVAIGLIDGPILMAHAALAGQRIREVPGSGAATCSRATSAACAHATFVAGILVARRDAGAPSICPDCTLLVRPIFERDPAASPAMPSASPEDLATAIVETMDAGARILNLSAAPARPSSKGCRDLQSALDLAAQRGVILVVAAGNQGTLGSSLITRHPWAIPVAACDLQGRPTSGTNLAGSIGRRGVSAPGVGVVSLGTDGRLRSIAGTSVAAPIVAGALALLWSVFPRATASDLKLAVTRAESRTRHALVPPLLDVEATFRALSARYGWN